MLADINPIVSQVNTLVAQPLALFVTRRGALGEAQAAVGGNHPMPS
jgi:hypothetical protein